MFAIRSGQTNDLEAICSFDKDARAALERSLGAGNCAVLETSDQVVAYAVLEYSFFE